MDLELSHRIQNDILVITPQIDKLDAMNASSFKDKVLNLLHQTQLSKLIFDLSQVQFIDSSGLGAFLAIQRAVKKQEGNIKIVHLSKNIQTLFEIVSMHRILDIVPSMEEAIKSF